MLVWVCHGIAACQQQKHPLSIAVAFQALELSRPKRTACQWIHRLLPRMPCHASIACAHDVAGTKPDACNAALAAKPNVNMLRANNNVIRCPAEW